MNEFLKDAQDLHKQLRAQSAQCPTCTSVALLGQLIQVVAKFDDIVEKNQDQERKNQKLVAVGKHQEEINETLIAKNEALTNNIESLKQSAEHWERVEKDKMTRAMVAG